MSDIIQLSVNNYLAQLADLRDELYSIYDFEANKGRRKELEHLIAILDNRWKRLLNTLLDIQRIERNILNEEGMGYFDIENRDKLDPLSKKN